MPRLTLADVLCRAAEEIAAATERDDRERLQNLYAALQFLYDVNSSYGGPAENYAEHYRDAALEELLDDMLYAIGESLMGSAFKGEIPSHETIRMRLA